MHFLKKFQNISYAYVLCFILYLETIGPSHGITQGVT